MGCDCLEAAVADGMVSSVSHSHTDTRERRGGYLRGGFFPGRVGLDVDSVSCPPTSPVPEKRRWLYVAPPHQLPELSLSRLWAEPSQTHSSPTDQPISCKRQKLNAKRTNLFVPSLFGLKGSWGEVSSAAPNSGTSLRFGFFGHPSKIPT